MLRGITALITALRPRQWIKNLVLFAAWLFSLGERSVPFGTELTLLARTGLGFLLFCCVSSAIYLFNDIFDVRADRQHPKKRHRPIASGAVSMGGAWTAFIVLLGIGVGGAMVLNPAFGFVVLIYFLLFIAYTLALKRIVILDTLIIALGFVLRAVGGAMVTSVGISVWLIICTIFLALFLGFAKRRSELVNMGEKAVHTRSTLSQYTVVHLDYLLSICSSLAIVCYTMYSLSERAFQHVGPDSLLTLPFVIFGIFRYLFLVVNNRGGDDPASALTKDVPLLLSVGGWVLLWGYLMTVQPGILRGVVVL